MGKTFRIDNKDPLYKKLIKLPTTYYILQRNGNRYTIYSHNNGTVEIENTDNLKLKWENNNIVLYEGNSPLKVKKGNKEQNLIIEQEDIIGENKDDIIKELRLGEEVLISDKYIKDSTSSGVGLSFYSYEKGVLTGVLKFINFYDENDPVLQKIKGENGGLYFTIEGDYIYISDKNGKCLPVCEDGSCYKYQYTKDKCGVLTISDVSTIIGNLTETNNEKQKFTLQKGRVIG